MPNQRAANKQQFGLTLTKDEVAAIDAAAKRAGMSRTEYIRKATMTQLVKDSEQTPEITKPEK